MRYSELLRFTTPHRRTLLLIVLLLLADSAVALANPWIAGLLTKSILQGHAGALPAFQWILLGWFGLVAVMALCSRLRQTFLRRILRTFRPSSR